METVHPAPEMVLMRAVMWGLFGALYSVLLLGLNETFRFAGAGVWAIALAAPIAGAITAAFYGALQLGIVGAIPGMIVTMGYLFLFPGPASLLVVVALAAAGGAIAGAVIPFPEEVIHGTVNKTLAGAGGGLAAGLAISLAEWIYPGEIPLGIVVGVLVAGIGTLYVFLLAWLRSRVRLELSRTFADILLAAGFAVLVGISIWAVGGSITGAVDPVLGELVERALGQIPAAGIGGVLGGAIAGVLLEIFGRRWLYRAD